MPWTKAYSSQYAVFWYNIIKVVLKKLTATIKIIISHPTCAGHSCWGNRNHKIQTKIGCIMLNLENDMLLELRTSYTCDTGITWYACFFSDAQQIIMKNFNKHHYEVLCVNKNYSLKRHFYCWSIRLFRPMCQNVKNSHANFSLTELQMALQALQIQNLQRLNMKML